MENESSVLVLRMYKTKASPTCRTLQWECQMRVLFFAAQAASHPLQYAHGGTLTTKRCFSLLWSSHWHGYEADIRNRCRNGNMQRNGNRFCKTWGKKWVEYVGVKYMPKHRKHDLSCDIQNSRKVGWKNILNKIRVYSWSILCFRRDKNLLSYIY